MSLDINKTVEAASLDNLHDIILPKSIGLFPLAPGWIILLALFSTLLLYVIIKLYKRYKSSKYRREAKKELERYTQESKDNSLLLLALAKRVAIAAYGRKETATLSGNSWWDFMQDRSNIKVNT